jgi:hypothetical protein
METLLSGEGVITADTFEIREFSGLLQVAE